MVASTPILPTDKIPETKLKQYVGQSVIIKGTWYAGEIWKPNEAEMNMSMPVNPHHTEVIRGDGLKADSIKLMNKKGE